MRTWVYGLCGAAALMAVSSPIQAQVAMEPAERARATDEAQPTPPGITVLEPRSDAVETFECRSLQTLLMVAIPAWEEAGAWFETPFRQRNPASNRRPRASVAAMRWPGRWSASKRTFRSNGRSTGCHGRVCNRRTGWTGRLGRLQIVLFRTDSGRGGRLTQYPIVCRQTARTECSERYFRSNRIIANDFETRTTRSFQPHQARPFRTASGRPLPRPPPPRRHAGSTRNAPSGPRPKVR